MIAALYIRDLTWQEIYELRSLTGLDITKESINNGYDWVVKNEYGKYANTLIWPQVIGHDTVQVGNLEQFKSFDFQSYNTLANYL